MRAYDPEEIKARKEAKMSTHEKLHKLWEDHEKVSSQRGVPIAVQEMLNSAFAEIPVSHFPKVPSGQVVEISADASIAEAVQTLSKHNIFSAPVRIPSAHDKESWVDRYLGMVDYSVIIFWVLENAELAATVLASGSAAAAGMGAGAAGALGAVALGATGAGVLVGVTAAAIGAAVASGVAVEKGVGKDAPTAVNAIGEDFYKMLLQEEPFKSTKVMDITKSDRWAPFLPVQLNDSMLTVLLLMSKFRLRCVPVVEMDMPFVENLITQSAVVRGLSKCRGHAWFDFIAQKSLFQLGLPCMSAEQVISIEEDKPVLESFKLMRENNVGGLPVVQKGSKYLIGNISMRDIQFLLLKPELFASRKELSVIDFMRTASSLTSNALMIPSVACEENATLGEVIETLSNKGIHRIHVTNKEGQLIGVVTLRDIISGFVTEPPNYFDHMKGLIDENMSA